MVASNAAVLARGRSSSAKSRIIAGTRVLPPTSTWRWYGERSPIGGKSSPSGRRAMRVEIIAPASPSDGMWHAWQLVARGSRSGPSVLYTELRHSRYGACSVKRPPSDAPSGACGSVRSVWHVPHMADSSRWLDATGVKPVCIAIGIVNGAA
jgi:hypothetical protein